MAALRIPTATYRLQFNRGFRFAHARALVPYLHALGISDIYASPLLKARRGSTHGYDVVDPTRLNPELGGEEGFSALVRTLHQYGMGLLLDIVPNHMAATTENPWWLDVLQHGPRSPYARYFDINWQPARPGLNHRVLLPILHAPYGEVLEAQELTLVLAEDGFWVRYRDLRLPLSPASCSKLLAYRLEDLAAALGSAHPAVLELQGLLKRLKELASHRMKDEAFNAALRQVRERLWHLYSTCQGVKEFINRNLQIFNGRKGDPGSFHHLERILSEQAYRLAFWRTANQEINYRRFFDVSDLVSLRTEDEQVFAATHALILQLAEAGQVTGLRIDHIDGLRDPLAYLQRLQNRLSPAGSGFYIVAEKILAGGEELPAEWPVSGTTGYDFLNTVNGLFVAESSAAALNEIYAGFGGTEADFSAVLYTQKRRVMQELFAGEVRALARQLGRLAEQDRHGCDLTLAELEQALVEVTACLPIYRTYTSGFAVSARDYPYLARAAAAAIARNPAAARACNFLRRVLLLELPGCLSPAQRQEWLDFVMRWQQFTGPVTAKGLEDTALYVYNRLVSLNEVGGDPETLGVSVAEFHRRSRARQERWPHTLNATSTHDTKRSEDVRARINVLSEIPALWAERLKRWQRWNRDKKQEVNGRPVPDGNMELLIYQTLAGAWPLREEEVPAFKKRLQAYLVKAAREAKIHTSWLDPAPGYENALAGFAASILEPGGENRFLRDFLEFQKTVSYCGALNSLAQTLLKITAPGVPDFYQGTELWNFSLVDPDNRRPVDFEKRAALLAALQKQEAGGLAGLVQELLACWEDGRVKLFLTYKALHFRRAHRELFARGAYIPLDATGPLGAHVCAFLRRLENSWALVAVPRLLAKFLAGQPPAGPLAARFPPGADAPEGSALVLAAGAPERWRSIFTGAQVQARGASPALLPVADLFRDFPVALLEGTPS
ncbi:MAG: malto-oligosyltrehalose synthase [Firmicutes bacterium]|nr:malto-oligosyltrehalose synthase [Bacillota bacterium]